MSGFAKFSRDYIKKMEKNNKEYERRESLRTNTATSMKGAVQAVRAANKLSKGTGTAQNKDRKKRMSVVDALDINPNEEATKPLVENGVSPQLNGQASAIPYNDLPEAKGRPVHPKVSSTENPFGHLIMKAHAQETSKPPPANGVVPEAIYESPKGLERSDSTASYTPLIKPNESLTRQPSVTKVEATAPVALPTKKLDPIRESRFSVDESNLPPAFKREGSVNVDNKDFPKTNVERKVRRFSVIHDDMLNSDAKSKPRAETSSDESGLLGFNAYQDAYQAFNNQGLSKKDILEQGLYQVMF